MPDNTKPTIYCLPGRGGQLGTGLGQALLDRGFGITGRETRGDFADWDFSDQVACVADDIGNHFWRADALVIANSFGAYLLLHALAGKVAFPGRVLILSPIVGESFDAVSGQSFVPPRAGDLHKLSRAGAYPRPNACEIHVGKDDWQSNPASVCLFAQPLDIPVEVLKGQGHTLDKDYVSGVLDGWLNDAAD
jgi:hypothetical protein